MSDSITVARPYAKAIFEHALSKQKLGEWSEILHDLAVAVLMPETQEFISSPDATAEQHVQLLLALFNKSKNNSEIESITNLINLLANNKRLLLLADIEVLFEAFKAEQEKTLIAYVKSFSELTKSQQQQLTTSLSERLQRRITLEIELDRSLLGGAVIRAGDLVIDGSVRGKLNKLGNRLAA